MNTFWNTKIWSSEFAVFSHVLFYSHPKLQDPGVLCTLPTVWQKAKLAEPMPPPRKLRLTTPCWSHCRTLGDVQGRPGGPILCFKFSNRIWAANPSLNLSCKLFPFLLSRSLPKRKIRKHNLWMNLQHTWARMTASVFLQNIVSTDFAPALADKKSTKHKPRPVKSEGWQLCLLKTGAYRYW